jgi:hypothetical protein
MCVVSLSEMLETNKKIMRLFSVINLLFADTSFPSLTPLCPAGKNKREAGQVGAPRGGGGG